MYKNKNVLIEAIHKMKQEKIREKQLEEQRDARKIKATEKKEKRNHRKQVTMGIVADEPKAKKDWAHTQWTAITNQTQTPQSIPIIMSSE